MAFGMAFFCLDAFLWVLNEDVVEKVVEQADCVDELGLTDSIWFPSCLKISSKMDCVERPFLPVKRHVFSPCYAFSYMYRTMQSTNMKKSGSSLF